MYKRQVCDALVGKKWKEMSKEERDKVVRLLRYLQAASYKRSVEVAGLKMESAIADYLVDDCMSAAGKS